MRKASKIVMTEGLTYSVGGLYKDKDIIDHINVIYPIAKLYTMDNALPLAEVYLSSQVQITWVEENELG